MKNIVKTIQYLFMTLFLIVLSRYVMVFMHEYTHSILAWLLNAKSLPFDIYYGDWTLLKVDEAVNYWALYYAGRLWTLAFIAIAPTILNAMVYLGCLYLLTLRPSRLIYASLFWFGLMNLSEVFAYIPIRTFGTHGDIHNALFSLNLSPWWIYLPGTLLVGIAIGHFYKMVLPRFYSEWQLTFSQQIITLFFAVFALFFVFGSVGLTGYGEVSHVFSGTAMAFAPVLFVLCFPPIKKHSKA